MALMYQIYYQRLEMKFWKPYFVICKTFLLLAAALVCASAGWAQKSAETISTVVIDSAPKKLYSELYFDENSNQFMVEIYEEPQEGENLIHFRSFKNGKIIGRKSQVLAEAHNFTFFIDESEQRLMREESADLLYKVLKKVLEESDQKLKSKLEEMFDQEKMAKSLSEKIKTPDNQIRSMADQISEQITFDGGTISDMATRISKEIETPDEQISEMATRISKEIKVPDQQIAGMAGQISDQITFDGGAISDMATRISKEIKTPDEQISTMAEQISQQIKTPEARVDEENLALTLAIRLTQNENLVAAKIPPYAELLSQVTESNEQQDYEKAIDILDEDIADRTPDEQRKALKISGLMSVLVASKKLKRAISTIDDYDLPDDPGLREVSAALSEWLSNNIVSE